MKEKKKFKKIYKKEKEVNLFFDSLNQKIQIMEQNISFQINNCNNTNNKCNQVYTTSVTSCNSCNSCSLHKAQIETTIYDEYYEC